MDSLEKYKDTDYLRDRDLIKKRLSYEFSKQMFNMGFLMNKYTNINEMLGAQLKILRGMTYDELCCDNTVRMYDIHNNIIYISLNEDVIDTIILEKIKLADLNKSSEYIHARNVLLNSDRRAINVNGKHIISIESNVLMWLLKKNTTDFVYMVLNGDTRPNNMSGDTIEIWKDYINKSGRINITKRMVETDDIHLDYDSTSFEFDYIKLLHYRKIDETKNDDSALKEITQNVNIDYINLCKDNNISMSDFIFRVKTGINEDDALAIGIYERDTYGLYYDMKGSTAYINLVYKLIKQLMVNEKC